MNNFKDAIDSAYIDEFIPISSYKILQVQKLTSTAQLPTKGSKYSAGLDLYSDNKTNIEIKPGERKLIDTGIAATAPKNCYIRIAPRSGLAVKNGIDVLAGVVDRDYTGEIKVVLYNTGNVPFVVEPKTRIAQIIVERYEDVSITEVETLTITDRGSGGFGSTG